MKSNTVYSTSRVGQINKTALPKVTAWFPADARPKRQGWYQVQEWLMDGRAMDDEVQMAWWGGLKWFYFNDSVFPIPNGVPSPWRGLASNPAKAK